jgi:hypothetical protein
MSDIHIGGVSAAKYICQLADPPPTEQQPLPASSRFWAHAHALFNLDIETDKSFIGDDEGSWFLNVETARREAAEAATAIIWETKVDSVAITVRDSAGNTVGLASASLQTEQRSDGSNEP